MKDKLFTLLRFFVFLSIGLLLFWLVYRDQPMDEIIDALKKADYFWIGIALVLSLFSHISRALRWNILINSLEYYPKAINTFFAVMIMYLSNTAIPRSGEIARCGIIKRYEDVPFSKLLGTVVVERAIDFVVLFILLFIVLITQFPVILQFIENNPTVGDKFAFLGETTNLIIIGIFSLMFIVALFLLRNKMKNTIFYLKAKELLKNFWEGIKTVKKLKRKWLFIAHSLFIWIMYFIMIYVTFWSFEFTSHLSLLTGLTIFVMASFGMVAPSPGGIGTWHFMVIETLVIYGVERTPDANAFAFAAHGTMTLMLVIVGLVSLALIPVVNKKRRKFVEKEA
jgi:glycosyltransferase 2 family protein